MKPIQSELLHSLRGVPVHVKRLNMADTSVAQVELRYKDGGRGKVGWWPDTPKCRAQIALTLNRFLKDETSLGVPIPEVTDEERRRLIAMRPQ